MDSSQCKWSLSWENNGVQVIDCAVCGFKHQYPFPSQQEVSEFYQSEYYEKVKPEYLDQVKSESDNRRMWASDKLTIFNKHLTENPGKKRILDVGCSFGTFLQFFQENGWECVGVEPSAFAARFARDKMKLHVKNGLLESFSLEDLGGPFDVVHIKETLDYLSDPEAFIQRASQELVAEGGLLCIETANQFNQMQMAAVKTSRCPYWWIVPDHVSYFDSQSLIKLTSKYRFMASEMLSTFPMELFLLMGENYVLDASIGPACHKRRLHFEDVLFQHNVNDLRLAFYHSLAEANLGRGLILTSRLGNRASP